MPVLRTLEIENRSYITSHLRRHPPEVSELTFTNLFVWRGHRPIRFAEVDGSMVFLAESQHEEPAGQVVFGSPVGGMSPAEVSDQLGMEIEGFVRIPGAMARKLEEVGLTVEPDRANWDYVHKVEHLAELPGRHFHKKRNLVKQCLASYRCEYEPIGPEVLMECRDMQDRWCEARQCGINPGLCMEYAAIRELFAHYEGLELIGGAIRVDGKIEAYSIGEELRPGTAVCHFEKAMPGVKGLGQLINQWFAKYSLSEFEFVNREQDLGIPGLRQAKESYFPDHMVEKFTARFIESRSLPPLVDPRECAKHGHPDSDQ
jgi:hypothetical protein